MNYYSAKKYKQAATGDVSSKSFLERLGVSDEIINLALSIENPQSRQKAIGFLRKNPKASLENLRNFVSTIKIVDKKETNTPKELQFIQRFENPEFRNWLAAFFREARKEYLHRISITGEKSIEDTYLITGLTGKVHISLLELYTQEIYDWYVRGILPAREAYIKAQTLEEKSDVCNEFGVVNPNTDLASLTFLQANKLATEWHDVVSGQGEGLEYYNEKENIVYGPKWKNPNFQGWTIRSVTTKNNLKAEGNKMGQCAGSYYNDVRDGKTRIFSLRNPQNVPYVTMEVSPSVYEFRQIYGNGPKTGNVEPGANLKAILKEWISTLPNPSYTSEFDYNNLEHDTLADDLHDAIYKDYESYGLNPDLENIDMEFAYDAVKTKMEKRRGYNCEMAYPVAKVLARAAYDSDVLRINKNLFDEKNTKQGAYRLALKQPKFNVMRHADFTKLSDENKSAYVKDYLQDALSFYEYLRDRHKKQFSYDTVDLENPQKFMQKVHDRAFNDMVRARKYDENSIKSFDDLEKDDQIKYLAARIDKEFEMATLLHLAEKHTQELFEKDYWYEDDLREPDIDDFESESEYAKAYQDYENERDANYDNYIEELRSVNLPYCLDDAIHEEIQKILATKDFVLPDWVYKYFPNQQSHYMPSIMRMVTESSRLKNQNLDNKQSFGWYGLCKFAESFKVKKTHNIYAVDFVSAKKCDIINEKNILKLHGKNVKIDKNTMICKDDDGNMWTEDLHDFEKRYTKIDSPKQDCWSEYHPTKHAINIAEKQDDGTYLMHEENDKEKSWHVNKSEFKKYYKKAQSEEIVYRTQHVDHYKGQDEYFLQALLHNSEKCVGKMTCMLVGNIFYVYDIEVHKDYRRLGIGKNLISKMLEEKPDAKVIPVGVTTDGKKFWRNLHRSKFIK